MLGNWTNLELLKVDWQLEATLAQMDRLYQAKRRERGAWVKPGLADSAAQLEKQLLSSYWKLARDLIASLKGSSDDIVSGRLAQGRDKTVTEAEEAAALDYFDLDEADRDHRIDQGRLAAILALIALWLTRHQRIAEEAGGEMFDKGRAQAVKDANLTAVAPGPTTAQLRGAILNRYAADIERLRDGLSDGTKRSYGIQWIVANAATLGLAATYLRRLFDAEAFRIEMLSEHLVWSAWVDGQRAGAIEATRQILRDKGVHLEEVSLEGLTDEEQEGLPRYRWEGPDDAATCDPCREQFGEPVVALSLDDLPSPFEICRFGLSCRHHWQPV